MADTMTRSIEDREYERDSIPSDEYRSALVSLLAVHAVPVWAWGQRDAYASMVMDGPSLDQWVLTSNLWAEAERDLWEWEQLIDAIADEPSDAVVGRVIGSLAQSTPAALESWFDLIGACVTLSGLGEQLVRTFTESSYGPLARHARLMVMYKRGQTADGISAFRQGVQREEFSDADVEATLAKWSDIARTHAEAVAALQGPSRWTELGLATEFDPEAAVREVDSLIRQHLKG